MNFKELMDNAFEMIVKGENVPLDETSAFSGLSMAYSLIAIARELHQINERADIEIERQELVQARKERSKEIW